MTEETTYLVFAGERLLITAPLAAMLRRTKEHIDDETRAGRDPSVLIFEQGTGKQVDFDFQGTLEVVLARALPRVGPGRPRLGVVAREVSLLPRHWEWLEQQQSGASAALRRLVDEARKHDPAQQQCRLARDAAYRFMNALAGDRPGFEEATRALYAGDAPRFAALIAPWPADLRHALTGFAKDAFATA